MFRMSSKESLYSLGIFFALVAAPGTTLADNGCSTAPKSKFQDRAKLDDMLKPKGLMINKILDDNGCYKVIAVTKEFKTVLLFFNSETLKQVDKGTADDSDPDLQNSESVGD